MMFDSTVWVIYNCLQSVNVTHRLRGVVYIKKSVESASVCQVEGCGKTPQ